LSFFTSIYGSINASKKFKSYKFNENIDFLRDDYVVYFNKELRKQGTKTPSCYKDELIDVYLKLKHKDMSKQDSFVIDYNFLIVRGGIGISPASQEFFGGINSFSTTPVNGSEELRTDRGEIKRVVSTQINNKIYEGIIFEIYKTKKIYISKYVGIVGWKNSTDTFNLIRYYIAP
jgi:hypothetical protein